MITIENCNQVKLERLKLEIDSIRTRVKDYSQDELFRTLDNKYLVLCHTISEGSMGAYYCQQAIFRNNDSCELLINMNNFWTPHWMKHFNYIPNMKYYCTSVTCYDKDTNSNPTPTIIIDIENNSFALESKETRIEEKYNPSKGWIKWELETNICELFKVKYARKQTR